MKRWKLAARRDNRLKLYITNIIVYIRNKTTRQKQVEDVALT
jgi:hypothetical protein